MPRAKSKQKRMRMKRKIKHTIKTKLLKKKVRALKKAKTS